MRCPGSWSRARRDRQHDAVVGALQVAWRRSDADAVRALLAPDAAVVLDSGRAEPRTRGAGAAASVLLALPGEPVAASVNGRVGLVARRHDTVLAVVSLRVRGDRIAELWITTAPGKLTHWI